MLQPHYAQPRYLSMLVLTWLVLCFLTRSVQQASHLAHVNLNPVALFGLKARGGAPRTAEPTRALLTIPAAQCARPLIGVWLCL